MVNPVVKNYFDPVSKKFIVGGDLEVQATGKITVLDGGEVVGITGVAAAATADALGGIKAATKGAGDTVECKIDEATSKLYCAPYTLPEAAADAIGGVKLAANVAAVAAEGELADVITALNAVLTALKASGAMAADTP